MPTRSTFANAVIGGVVAVVLFFIPFSPVLGGGVAGYLQGRDGLRVGALAGALASIPAVVLVFIGAAFVPIWTGELAMAKVALLTGLVLIAAYGIFLGAGGGAIGVLLATRGGDDDADTAGSDLVSGDGDSVGAGPGDSDVDGDDDSVGDGDSGEAGHTVDGDSDGHDDRAA